MANSAEKSKSQTEILKLPYLVLIVSLLITLGATFIFYKNAQAKDLLRFENEATRVKNRIEIFLNTYIMVLKAGRGFIEGNEKPDQKAFGEFVKKMELKKNHSGLKVIGYIKNVSPEGLSELADAMKAGGFPDFKIFPESSNPDKHPVIFLEALANNDRHLIGFDMGTAPEAQKAIQKASLSGEPAATGKIKLLDDADDSQGAAFIIFVPVYRTGAVIPEGERKSFPDGFVYSRFHADSFLQEIQNSISVSDISVTIYESEKSPDNILAQSGTAGQVTGEGYNTTGEIQVAGRKWIIDFQSQPSFSLQSSTGWTPLIFISGLIFSMLFFGITYLESSARARAEKISSELQESEREKGILLEREQLERRRAEEASKTKDEFISIVSHELRTPLNSIAGWTKILKSQNLSPASRNQALQKIEKNLRTQTRIVEEVLDFSQLVSRKSELSHQRLDFSEIFESEFAEAAKTAEERGVFLVKENILNGQRVYGDPERLRRVVDNLLSNAIKFTPRGGKITAKVEENGSCLEMTVSDTGQGIAPEFLPHIFERFRQADSSTTRRYGGLGLGLAITRHIIRLHGGSIEVSSEGEGKGSTFIVRLPFEREISSPEA